MLNRLFIVVGVLAILVIVAAFIAPFFVDWSSYRVRMEVIASETLGTDVRINGDIDVTLLPQPRLSFDTVMVGPPDAPLAVIASVQAEFSLMDFMRDRYAITRLVLSGPQFNLHVDENGQFVTPLHLRETVSASNISVADADIEGGIVRLSDARTGEAWEATGFDGNVQIAGLRGPFSLQGLGSFDGARYDVRINTSSMNAEDTLQMTVFTRPVAGAFSFGVEGILKTKGQLEFTGKAVFRQLPPDSLRADEVRGDLIFTSDVEANAAQILFSDYVIVPDENRPATRLTGAAVVHLGVDPEFDAVISGGVVALSPRDALVEEADGPYELMRLIAELPAPMVPPIAGRIGIDVSELNLRAFSLRELRIDARSDGEQWSIGTLIARMPGNTEISLVGDLQAMNGKPVFDGAVSINTTRLDGLVGQWRKAAENNPLFNMPSSLAAQIYLADGKLALSDGRFVLDGVSNQVGIEIDARETKRLSVSAQLGQLDDLQSRALRALMPDVTSDAAFALTFPQGDFAVTAERVTLFDLAAQKVDVAGSWAPENLMFDRLGIENIGGARVDVSGVLTGTLMAPVVSGKGQLSLAPSAETGAVTALLAVVDAPQNLRAMAGVVVPAELGFELSVPDVQDAQNLSLHGRVGVADVDASFVFTDGVLRAATTPLTAEIELGSPQVLAFAEQFGLGPLALVPEGGPVAVRFTADGTPSNSLEVDLIVEGSGDRSRFFGNVIVSDLTHLRGKGKLEFVITDVAPFAEMLGAEGVGYSGVSGSADLNFTGADILALTNIDAEVGEVFLSGELSRSTQGADMLFTGSLRASEVEAANLAALIGGPSSLVVRGDVWPEGPFALANAGRQSRGRVHVATPFVRHDGRDIARDANFDLAWDDSNLRVRAFEASLGGGTLGVEAEICCAGGLSERQISGRVTLSDVAVDAILPNVPAAVLDGVIEGGMTFSAIGDSFAAMFDGMAGQGSFAITDFAIEKFDPLAFARVAEIKNILELGPEELTSIVEDALQEGPFKSQAVGGVFSIAAGDVRVANLAAEGDVARLFGGTTLSLVDLALAGDWALTPTTRIEGEDGLVSAITSQVGTILSGTLQAPKQRLDLGPMIDAIKVRAYEIELDRLEKLRAEEEARARVAAEERAQLMEEQARRRAAEELERATAEAAKRERAEATRRALEKLAEELGPSRDPRVNQQDNGDAPIDLLPDLFAPPASVFDGQSNSF